MRTEADSKILHESEDSKGNFCIGFMILGEFADFLMTMKNGLLTNPRSESGETIKINSNLTSNSGRSWDGKLAEMNKCLNFGAFTSSEGIWD